MYSTLTIEYEIYTGNSGGSRSAGRIGQAFEALRVNTDNPRQCQSKNYKDCGDDHKPAFLSHIYRLYIYLRFSISINVATLYTFSLFVNIKTFLFILPNNMTFF